MPPEEENIMVKNEEFYKIKALFEAVPEIDIHPKHGGRFRFQIYMTDSMSKTDIEALELSVRSINCLKRAGIHTIGELCDRVRCSSDLKGIRNCGKTSIAEIMDNLFAYQYFALQPERRGQFLAKVVEMNVNLVE